MRGGRRRAVTAVAIWAVATGAATPSALRAARPGGAGVDEHIGTPIPAFARMYGTACSTCHTAAPKLNVLGEAFRLNGYEMPDTRLLERADQPVPLGAEPWKDAWPRSIWPGELPGAIPMALRVQSDVLLTRDERAPSSVTYRFPHEIYLLAGGPLGGGVSTFLEVEWSEASGIEVQQAKIGFRDLVPELPQEALGLNLGLLNPFLLTFTDRQIDRAGRQKLAWQDFGLDQVAVQPAGGGDPLRSDNETVLGTGVAAVELQGLVGGRFHWGAGLAQGVGSGVVDRNGHKDPYYRVRVKLGGLDYRGRYDRDGGPVPGAGGQLLDRSVTLEHFGYFGNESTPDAPTGGHRALGWAARVLEGRLDAGVGHVRRSYRRPFGTAAGSLDVRAWFAKAEYQLFPWLIGSLKYDRLRIDEGAGALPVGHALAPADRDLVLPGVVMLVRQNVRLVVEGELLRAADRAVEPGVRRPHALWLRLDLTF